MTLFDPSAYGPVFTPLLAIDRRRPLDAGQRNDRSTAALSALSVKEAFPQVADSQMAECCLAGIWLLHDCLDESHAISQRINSPEGSFWHASMHRREGDFSNAKYWFRHVGEHPTFAAIGQRATALAALRGDELTIQELAPNSTWDPFAFVDLCQSVVRGKAAARELCLHLQQAEWEALFDYCYRAAVDTSTK